MKAKFLFPGALIPLLLLGCLQQPDTEPDNPTPKPNLVGLVFSAGALTPAFDSSTLTYSIAVANAVTSTTVRPTGSPASDASILVNGTAVASGSTSASLALAEGPNTFSIVVTAGSAQKTYTVTVTRAKQVQVLPQLSGLIIGTRSYNLFEFNGVVPAPFKPADTVYTVAVGVDTVRLGIYPTVADAQTQMTVNGTTVASGGDYVADVANPPVTIRIVLTSPTGARRTYSIMVTRSSSGSFASPVKLTAGAQAATAGSALDLDKGMVLLSGAANAQQESIDLVFLFYAGAFHLDNPVAAKAAGGTHGINLTNSYDSSRIKDTRIAKVATKPSTPAAARAALQAATHTPSNVVSGGEIFVVQTSEGRIAVVTVDAVTGNTSTGSAELTLSLGGL